MSDDNTNNQGGEVKLGSHSLKERNEFLDTKIKRYVEKHPEGSMKKARKYARVKWARKVNAELKKKLHPNKPRVTKKVEVKKA